MEAMNEQCPPNVGFEDIIHRSREIADILDIARRAAESDVTVFITGETGTGKELVAQAIHSNSKRKDGPFIPINCAAVPDTLLESELFGHEKGAYTDAKGLKKGRFELADKGTLLLDEIGDMPLTAQAKLLRAIETQTFERIGGEESISVNTRIIASTNKRVLRELKEKRFRKDLYYRLNEVRIDIPPLRARKDDIPGLVDHFIAEFGKQFDKKIKGVSRVCMSYLMRHEWPGNVRELKGAIRSGIAMMDSDVLWLEHLPFKFELKTADTDRYRKEPEEDLSLKEMEGLHILRILEKTSWNKKETASLLEISRPRLDRKIKAYDLDSSKKS